jgi:hypothetical protein
MCATRGVEMKLLSTYLCGLERYTSVRSILYIKLTSLFIIGHGTLSFQKHKSWRSVLTFLFISAEGGNLVPGWLRPSCAPGGVSADLLIEAEVLQ